MTVQQVYEKYSTPKNLQEHMLRVAALSKIICDNWTGKNINGSAIIIACLLHDIAKPMKFDITKQSGFGMPQDEILKLEKLQKFIKDKYGDDEHTNTIGMSKDVGIKEDSIQIIENLEWKYTNRLLTENDTESLIAVYCDRRVGPKGVLSLQQRLDDLKVRAMVDYYDDYVKNGEILEMTLQEFVSVKLNSITDENLNPYFPGLLNLQI